MNVSALSHEPIDERFEVLEPIGSGATAQVYRARDIESGELVALKIFHAPDPYLHEEGIDQRLCAREEEILKSVAGPGIVRVIKRGYIEALNQHYLASEWVDGIELGEWAKRVDFQPRLLAQIFSSLAQTLGDIHAAGLVHQDIKPQNILLRRRLGEPPQAEGDLSPLLLDFGSATPSGSPSAQGTPAYMSPEQARSDAAIDHLTDLYSLGATFFDLCVGHPPHQSSSQIATLARLATTPAPRISHLNAKVPAPLDDIVAQLLETEKSARPRSARQVERLLQDYLDAPEESVDESREVETGLGTGASRLVTTVVFVGLPAQHPPKSLLPLFDERRATAAPVGKDALVAHFGVEKATGGEAVAAIEMGRRLADWGAKVGIASGRARLDYAAGGRTHPVGEVVDRAASLAREAAPKMVLADITTSELGRGRYEFKSRDAGSSVVGNRFKMSSEDRGGGAPFVGREAETAQILAAYHRARAEATPLLISLTGAPGIGKSRLQREALTRIMSKADAPRVVAQRSDPYARRHVLGAAADILRSLLALGKGASLETAEAAIDERLGPATKSEISHENQRLLAQLLTGKELPKTFDPTGARDALWLAMTDLLERALSSEAVLLILEDLQWADLESIHWLEHILGRSTRFPLLLFACMRPQYWEENETSFPSVDHLRIALRPISQKAIRSIAEAMVPSQKKLTQEVLQTITEQAGGSPLFAEELARLAALGKMRAHTPTIEAAIQASLDALGPQERDAVGRLSVLGLACWDRALEALDMKAAPRLLSQLCAEEILLEQETSRFSDTKEYLFKHALVRDVAYQTLGEDERRQLHLLAGNWLSSMGEDSSTIAGHFDLAGKPSLAAAHWEVAAKRALSANALADALKLAEQALAYAENKQEAFVRASYVDEAWSRTDPRAADRDSAIAAMHEAASTEEELTLARGARTRYDDARGQGQEISERLASIRDRAATLGLHDEEARCSATLALRQAYGGLFDQAQTEVERLLSLSSKTSLGTKVDAYQTLAMIQQGRGAVSAAIDARKKAADTAREAGLKEREATLTTNLGFALSTVGARQEARLALERGLILAESIGSAGASRHAKMNLLGWASLYGNDKRLELHLHETRAEADSAATGFWAAPDRSNLGMLYYRGVELLRSPTETSRALALVLLKMTAHKYRELNHRDVLPVSLGMWAEAERLAGNLNDSIRIRSEAALLIKEGAPSLLNEAPIYLTLYKAKIDADDEAGALVSLRQSVPLLARRVQGLSGSNYARAFLTELRDNAELVAAAEAHGILPGHLARIIEGN